jgi:hypothetical protein
MQALSQLGQLIFGKLPFCSLVGAMIGIVAGTLLGLSQPALGAVMPPLNEVFTNSLLLALVGWITVVIVFGVWLHYGIAAIAPPAAVNAIITAFLTTWLDLKVHHPSISPLLGMLVGILVGLLLCQFCRPVSRATGRQNNG